MLKLFLPRYVIPLTLLAGLVVAFFQGLIHTETLNWVMSEPVWVTPAFSLSAFITFLVTASGISLVGVGSAFWGLVIGLLAYHLGRRGVK